MAAQRTACAGRRAEGKAPALPYAVYRIGGDVRDEALWAEIRRLGEGLSCPAGRSFSSLVAHPHDVFCIERGSLRQEYLSGEGRRRLLLVYGVGAIFNTAPAVLEKAAAGAPVVLEDCRLWRIPGEHLREERLLAASPRLARQALRILSSVMLTYHEALTELAVDAFLVRFCRYLLLNMGRFGTEFRLGLTQSECAATLGVHRATLARAVQWLRRRGILAEFGKRRVRILDPEALARAGKA